MKLNALVRYFSYKLCCQDSREYRVIMALIGYWSRDNTLVENSGNGLDLQLYFGSSAHTTPHRKNGFDFDTTNCIHVINTSAHLVQPQMSIALWMKPDLTSIDNEINRMVIHKFLMIATVIMVFLSMARHQRLRKPKFKLVQGGQYSILIIQ